MSPDQINALANYAIISRAENRTISDLPPSEYRSLMPQDATAILESALVPPSLFDDEFEMFLSERAIDLAIYLTRSSVRMDS